MDGTVNSDCRWDAQHAWNARSERRTDGIDERVQALEQKGYFMSGVYSTIGAMLGSGLVASLVAWLFS